MRASDSFLSAHDSNDAFENPLSVLLKDLSFLPLAFLPEYPIDVVSDIATRLQKQNNLWLSESDFVKTMKKSCQKFSLDDQTAEALVAYFRFSRGDFLLKIQALITAIKEIYTQHRSDKIFSADDLLPIMIILLPNDVNALSVYLAKLHWLQKTVGNENANAYRVVLLVTAIKAKLSFSPENVKQIEADYLAIKATFNQRNFVYDLSLTARFHFFLEHTQSRFEHLELLLDQDVRQEPQLYEAFKLPGPIFGHCTALDLARILDDKDPKLQSVLRNKLSLRQTLAEYRIVRHLKEILTIECKSHTEALKSFETFFLENLPQFNEKKTPPDMKHRLFSFFACQSPNTDIEVNPFAKSILSLIAVRRSVMSEIKPAL